MTGVQTCALPIYPAAFATTAELHQAVAAVAERHIRAHLDQWCIFRTMWSAPQPDAVTDPAGEGHRAGV